MKTTAYLSISAAAEALGLHIDSIRRWEKKGLIKSFRDDNNYRVFSLEEIERVKAQSKSSYSEQDFKVLKTPTKEKTVSIELFAGAGGLALGFENAGISHNELFEIDVQAANTLKLNRPDWRVVQADVRNVDFDGLDADVVCGGFPCQAFSYAGRKLGFEDTRGTLFLNLHGASNRLILKLWWVRMLKVYSRMMTAKHYKRCWLCLMNWATELRTKYYVHSI